jgi:hypothetical protein
LIRGRAPVRLPQTDLAVSERDFILVAVFGS